MNLYVIWFEANYLCAICFLMWSTRYHQYPWYLINFPNIIIHLPHDFTAIRNGEKKRLTCLFFQYTVCIKTDIDDQVKSNTFFFKWYRKSMLQTYFNIVLPFNKSKYWNWYYRVMPIVEHHSSIVLPFNESKYWNWYYQVIHIYVSF